MRDISQLQAAFGHGIAEQCVIRGEEPTSEPLGPDLVLHRFSDGTEVLQTNGEPIWDSEDGFYETIQELRRQADYLEADVPSQTITRTPGR